MSAPTAQPAQPDQSDPPDHQAARQALQGPLVLQGQAYPAPREPQAWVPQGPQVQASPAPLAYKEQRVQELLVLPELAAMALPELPVLKGQPALAQPALRELPAHKAQLACLAS
jgi:hypothetical protein